MVGDTEGSAAGAQGQRGLALRDARPTTVGARAAAVDAADATNDAVRALRLALHAARIKLPHLQADERTCDHFAASPFVELGSVHPAVALELAEVISEGALYAAARTAEAPARTGQA